MKNVLTFFVCLATLAISTTGRAATLTVTSTADGGAGSLRAALAAAANGDTINFSVTGAVSLTSGQLPVNRSVAIIGPGAANLAVQRDPGATNAFRVFNILPGNTVLISGLTIAHGSDIDGAGIHNADSTLRLSDSVILGNTAQTRGGGIVNLGQLWMSNCVVSGNQVVGGTGLLSGGGIFNGATMTNFYCVIWSNSVTAGQRVNAQGGGVSSVLDAHMTNCWINFNTVVSGTGGLALGGGLFNSGTIDVNTTTIAANVSGAGTNSGPAAGGGIASSLGTLTLDRSTVSGNFANGGSVSGGGPALPASVGGGALNDRGLLVIQNSTISGNAAALGGGLFNASGSLSLSECTITANAALGPMQSGGGLFNGSAPANFGEVEVINTILAGNHSSNDLFNAVIPSGSGDILSDGFNLFGTTNGPVIVGTNDTFNVAAAALRLGPLQNNGGPTLTHALLCGSPAIDAGNSTNAPAVDQRGFPRIVGSAIDIGAFEYSNSPPTIACPGTFTVNCAPSTGEVVSVTVQVADPDGDPLMVIWSVDGTAYRTNRVPAGGPPTMAAVGQQLLLSVGPHQISAKVADPSDCEASCITAVMVVGLGDLYPIALSSQTIAGAHPGDVLPDVYNGAQPGNFGWLTWAGSPSEPKLVRSLMPPGNSSTYINPFNPADHMVSVGDWVQGKVGLSNGFLVRRELDVLEAIDITLPVWDKAIGRGNGALYHVVGFAKVRILNYQLPEVNRITARFLSFTDCGASHAAVLLTAPKPGMSNQAE